MKFPYASWLHRESISYPESWPPLYPHCFADETGITFDLSTHRKLTSFVPLLFCGRNRHHVGCLIPRPHDWYQFFEMKYDEELSLIVCWFDNLFCAEQYTLNIAPVFLFRQILQFKQRDSFSDTRSSMSRLEFGDSSRSHLVTLEATPWKSSVSSASDFGIRFQIIFATSAFLFDFFRYPCSASPFRNECKTTWVEPKLFLLSINFVLFSDNRVEKSTGDKWCLNVKV